LPAHHNERKAKEKAKKMAEMNGDDDRLTLRRRAVRAKERALDTDDADGLDWQ
jgi:hypothetical protein